MSRLSFRPRPLDIHKKLPVVKNFKDFEDDDTPSSTRTHMLRLTAEPDIEVACVVVCIELCESCLVFVSWECNLGFCK